jgi:hypothetical protein
LNDVPNHLSRTRRRALRKRDRELREAKKKANILSWIVRVLLYVLSICGVSFFVSIAQAKPHIQLEHLDSKDAFRFPLRVVNDESFVTFYQVTPTSEWATKESSFSSALDTPGNYLHMPNTLLTLISAGVPSADIRPGDGHSFTFTMRAMNQTRIPSDLTLEVEIAYQIRFVPFIYLSSLSWHRQAHFSFHMQKDSNGTPYWVAD